MFQEKKKTLTKESHLYESEMARLPTEPEGKIMIVRATLREHATLIQGSQRRSWEIFAVQIDRQIDRVCLVDKCGKWGMSCVYQCSLGCLSGLAHRRRSIY